MPKPRTIPSLNAVKSFADIEQFMPPTLDVVGAEGPREYEFFRDCGEIPFESNATTYSPVNAWYMSELAFLAYVEKPTTAEVEAAVAPALARVFRGAVEVKVLLGAARRWGKPDQHDQIQCIVAHDGRTGVIAFRGTLPKSVPNWLTDADFVLVPEPGPKGMWVHKGFRGALDSVWLSGQDGGLDQYLAEMDRRHPGIRWWFTGHSLGAALATLAARRYGKAHALYSFGSPKVGNAAFATQVEKTVHLLHRVVNHRDIVTRLPNLPLFAHVGSLMHVEESTSATVAWLARIWDWLRRLLGLKSRWEAIVDKWFDNASRLKSGIEARSLMRACLDHTPICYSKILWNCLAAKYDEPLSGETVTEPKRARSDHPLVP